MPKQLAAVNEKPHPGYAEHRRQISLANLHPRTLPSSKHHREARLELARKALAQAQAETVLEDNSNL